MKQFQIYSQSKNLQRKLFSELDTIIWQNKMMELALTVINIISSVAGVRR